MKNLHKITTIPVIALLLFALAPSLSRAERESLTPYPGNYKCSIEAKNGTNTCDRGPIQIVSQNKNKAVVKVSLCTPANPTKNRQLEVTAVMGSDPRGWLLNIGDSASNDGWGGDTGSNTTTVPWIAGMPTRGQSRDAEFQINGSFDTGVHSWSLWGNDHIINAIDGHRQMYSEGKLNLKNKTVSITVNNEFLKVSADTGSGVVTREWNDKALYALAGQSDFQGPTNCDVYIGINQMVGSSGRNGNGVEKVLVAVIDKSIAPPTTPTTPTSVSDTTSTPTVTPTTPTAGSGTTTTPTGPSSTTTTPTSTPSTPTAPSGTVTSPTTTTSTATAVAPQRFDRKDFRNWLKEQRKKRMERLYKQWQNNKQSQYWY